ncbi:MAG: hypothetical protein KJZ65_05355 [Phycisphaerales bacterium]|nr:hypothetical protein [Phycisphaerales bacterium]
MLRFKRAKPTSLRAALMIGAMALPTTLTTPALADTSVSIYYGTSGVRAATIGTLTIDGRCYVIDACDSEREIARVFDRMGYCARFDGSRIVVETSPCRTPRFNWESCDYDLQATWRGDCLILCLRSICRPAPVYCPPPKPIVICPPPPPPPRVYCPPPRPIYSTPPRFDRGFSIRFRSDSDRYFDKGRDWGREGDNGRDRNWDRGRDHRSDNVDPHREARRDDMILRPWESSGGRTVARGGDGRLKP